MTPAKGALACYLGLEIAGIVMRLWSLAVVSYPRIISTSRKEDAWSVGLSIPIAICLGILVMGCNSAPPMTRKQVIDACQECKAAGMRCSSIRADGWGSIVDVECRDLVASK